MVALFACLISPLATMPSVVASPLLSSRLAMLFAFRPAQLQLYPSLAEVVEVALAAAATPAHYLAPQDD